MVLFVSIVVPSICQSAMPKIHVHRRKKFKKENYKCTFYHKVAAMSNYAAFTGAYEGYAAEGAQAVIMWYYLLLGIWEFTDYRWNEG